MASQAPLERAEEGCPAPAAAEQEPPPRAPGEEQGESAPEHEEADVAAGPQVEEAATVTWLLGEPVLWLGCRAHELLSWERPLRTLLGFVGANLLFW